MQASASVIGGEEILSTFKDGSGYRVMEEVLAQRLPSFYRTAYRFLGNSADAEDAVQDALLSAYKHLHEFRGESQLSTWLTAIVTNSARMHLRNRPRHTHVSLDEPIGEDRDPLSELLADTKPSPEDRYQAAELKGRLRKFARRLAPCMRKTFQLRELQGLSVHETATILKLSKGTVKAQLSRARAKLTKSMRRAFASRRR